MNRDQPNPLSTRETWQYAITAVGAFHIAYQWEPAGILVVVYLACLFRLCRIGRAKQAFMVGVAIGVGVAAPQLFFFATIFGPLAAGLWLVLGIWIGLFLLTGSAVRKQFPRGGDWLLPIIWFAFEYFRCELYYLRFAWLTPGFALSHPTWLPFVSLGVYGFSLVAGYAIVLATRKRIATAIAAAGIFASFYAYGLFRTSAGGERYVSVVGIQFEKVTESQIVETLQRAVESHREAEIFVLSEYTFNGLPPKPVREWCRSHGKFLIAGGTEAANDNGSFYNTVFVVSPDGKIVFRQVKSVPIQFFRDGLPAPQQDVWQSPWGKVGIAICYDLSYTRVMDKLIEDGAEALVIPTMDLTSWGEHQHQLHAKVAPVRAREYGIGICRVGSSGISQFVEPDGRILHRGSYPGQGEIIAGRLTFTNGAARPVDRFLGLPAVVLAIGLIIFLAIDAVRARKLEPSSA